MFGLLKRRAKSTQLISRFEPTLSAGFKGTPTSLRHFNQNAVTKNYFTIGTMSAKEVVTRDYLNILKSARQMLANNTYIGSYVQLMQRNVIGDTGVMLRMALKDIDINEKIEDDWQEWSKFHQCDARGLSSFTEILNQCLSNLIIDGECFILLEYRDDLLKLKVLDSALIDVSFNDPDRNIVNGIELNAHDEAVAYHFKSVNGVRQRVNADRIIHIFKPLFTGQRRGISKIANVIAKLEKLDGFENAALANAEKSAKFLAAVTRDVDDRDHMDDGDKIETDSGEEVDMRNQTPVKERQEISDGSIVYLNEGESIQTIASQYPSGEMKSFNQALLFSVSAGLGISYPLLTKDPTGVNFAGGRTGTLEDQNEFKRWQKYLVEHLIEPVFMRWAKLYAIHYPELSYEQLMQHNSYQARRWAWVDPKKDTDANKIAHDSNFKSLTQIHREQGISTAKFLQEKVEELQAMKKAGLAHDEQGRLVLASDIKADQTKIKEDN